MGTLNAFYVRATTDDAAIAAEIRAQFPNAEVQTDTQFWGVTLPEDAFEAPESDLMELSSRLKTDVLWLTFQSVVDAFQFHHWRAGQHLRSLVYGLGEERTWERAEGTPEPWEQDVFFDEGELTLEDLESEGASDAEIQPGRTEPDLDARECARKVAEYFHLPGWGL